MLAVIDDLARRLAREVAAGAIAPTELETGLEQIQLGAAQLALEAADAEHHGLGFDQAARDPEGFPRLVRAHNCVEDFLRLDVPRELRPLVRRALSIGEPPPEVRQFFDAMLSYAAHERRPEGALARFAFFELTRIGILVATWKERPRLARYRVDDALIDRLAASNARAEIESAGARMAISTNDGDAPDPLSLAIASSVIDASALHDLAARAFKEIFDELQCVYARRARVQALTIDAPADVTILVRNGLAHILEEPRVATERLGDLHPILAGVAPNTLDKRCSRSLNAIERGQPLPARKFALIDLLVKKWETAAKEATA